MEIGPVFVRKEFIGRRMRKKNRGRGCQKDQTARPEREARWLSVAQVLAEHMQDPEPQQNPSGSSSRLENDISFYENDIIKSITLCVNL